MKKIESVDALKKEAIYSEKTGVAEFFIALNFGARSSKGITYYPETNTFDVRNDIDDSYEEDLSEEQLKNDTHIVVAIENGAFFKYDS